MILVLQIAAGVFLGCLALLVLAALIDAAGSTYQGDMHTPEERERLAARRRAADATGQRGFWKRRP